MKNLVGVYSQEFHKLMILLDKAFTFLFLSKSGKLISEYALLPLYSILDLCAMVTV